MAKIKLSDEVRQSLAEPLGYFVFGTNDTYTEQFFHERQDAVNYATGCMERSGEKSWFVFPVYAGHPAEIEA